MVEDEDDTALFGSDLAPEVVTALTRAYRKEKLAEDRDRLTVGRHAVDATLRIHGSLTVAPDQEYSPTFDVSALLLLLLAMRRDTPKARAYERAVRDLVGEARNLSEVERRELLSRKDPLLEEARTAMGRLPKRARRGPVQVSVQIDEVDHER